MGEAGGSDPIGFFIDEDLPHAVVDLLRRHGITATSVVAEQRAGLTDEEQLCFAAAHHLVLVTANVADFMELARQWQSSGRDHDGLVFVMIQRFPRRDAGAIARALQRLGRAETPVQMRNSARFLARDPTGPQGGES